ncbi:tetratricopeptide repeat-containing diguanylate cyclase [Corallincola platygyrae]|uniref:tetratricopeptide repeat-containing diguanylate cyclase n=1 Tax=Corallincola platygyrae TaxID=1193278 RepID=UPI0031E9B1AB
MSSSPKDGKVQGKCCLDVVMRLKRFFIVLLWLVSGSLWAEPIELTDAQIWALKKLADTDAEQAVKTAETYLAQPLTESSRLKVLGKLCITHLAYSRYKKVEEIYLQTKPLLSKPGNKASLVEIESCHARAIERQGQLDEALTIYNDLIEVADAPGLDYQLSWVYASRGQLNSYRGNYRDSIKDITKAFALFEKSGVDDQHYMLQMMNAMGNTYGYMKQNDKALEYYYRVVDLLAEFGDLVGQSVATYNISNVLMDMERWQEAKTWAEKSRRLALEAKDELGVAYADVHIATCFANMGQLSEAIEVARQMYPIFTRYREMEGAASTLLKQARWMDELGDTEEAIPLAEEGLKLYRDSDAVAGIEKSLALLAELYANTEQHELAYDAMKERFELSEKIFDKDMNREVARMEAEFKRRTQDKENQLLRLQNESKQARIAEVERMRGYAVLFVATLIMVAVVLTWLLFVNRKVTRQMVDMARKDPLTGLSNRRHVLELLRAEKERAKRYSENFCVALMDVDHFKAINDTHGHHAGDQVLCAIAKMLGREVRVVDTASRYGGEEFLILFPNTDEIHAAPILERIRLAMTKLEVEDVPRIITASIGYAEYRGEDSSLEELLKRADTALYQAKSEGRNRTVSAGGAVS